MSQLAEPGRSALWDYLEQSGRRRHAVLVAVDGLQGHLMEALAGGAADDRFLDTIAVVDVDVDVENARVTFEKPVVRPIHPSTHPNTTAAINTGQRERSAINAAVAHFSESAHPMVGRGSNLERCAHGPNRT